MKAVPTELATMLSSKTRTLALCWAIRCKDGTFVRGTEHDRDLTTADIESDMFSLGGTYVAARNISGSVLRSGSDMAPDNLEVKGRLGSLFSTADLNANDIEAGVYDNAEVVLFAVDWVNPSDFHLILRYGNLGNITRTAEGEYRVELRGLNQRLAQIPIRTMGAACDDDLGGSRCSKDITAYSTTGEVATATTRRLIAATIAAPSTALAAGSFLGGKLTFTTGGNAGFAREIKRDDLATTGELEFYEPFPATIVATDEFNISPGCPKTREACRDLFDNVVNFQGFAVFSPTATDTFAGANNAKSGPTAAADWSSAIVFGG